MITRSTRPASEIARMLDVKHLVEGSVRQDSARVKITASLIDAARNTPVWSDDFERDRGDVMALQREVALAIAQAIRVRLTPQDQTRLAPTREPDPEALEDYLRGTQARYDANTTGEFDKAIPFLNAAVAKDSNYAAAYAGLASVYASMGDENKARWTSIQSWPTLTWFAAWCCSTSIGTWPVRSAHFAKRSVRTLASRKGITSSACCSTG